MALTPEQTRRLEEARQRQRAQRDTNKRIAHASFMTWLRETFTGTVRAIDPRKLAEKYLRGYRRNRRAT